MIESVTAPGESEVDRLRRENDHMRATLAIRGGPCQYCALPPEDWGKCPSGFPGCARADDAMMCPHFGAGVDEAGLRREVERLRAQLVQAKPRAWLLEPKVQRHPPPAIPIHHGIKESEPDQEHRDWAELDGCKYTPLYELDGTR